MATATRISFSVFPVAAFALLEMTEATETMPCAFSFLARSATAALSAPRSNFVQVVFSRN